MIGDGKENLHSNSPRNNHNVTNGLILKESPLLSLNHIDLSAQPREINAQRPLLFSDILFESDNGRLFASSICTNSSPSPPFLR